MNRRGYFNILKCFIFILAVGFTACDKDNSYNPGLPPDYVGDETEPEDSGEVYHYIIPQVDGEGRIIVAGRPPQYTDTATYHVLSVAYDIANSASMDLEAYYSRAIGKKGAALKRALSEIIKENFDAKSYGEARYIINIADRDPLYPNDSVWCFYQEKTGKYEWDGGATWNREHTWAKSHGLLGGSDISNSTISAASDLHNLKAENPSVNSSKSNRDFAELEGDEEFYGTHGDFAYAPMESARGDVARILMYMVLRWGDDNGIYLIDGVGDSRYSSTYQGSLTYLRKWNQNDPVDPFEVRRNNVIYQYQNNRNPFVDHPELVEYVFGDKQDKVWNGGMVYNP